jgi:hypothetical protein
MASGVQSRSRLGQSGPLTGEQLYIKVNCNLALVGEPSESVAPAPPSFEANIVTGIELLNPAGAITVKLTASGTSTAFNVVFGARPVSAGREVQNDYRFLGLLPAVTSGKANITSIYSAKFGLPPAGSKVFVRTHQILAGYADLPHSYSGIVPASS